jgi:hypothetical protein
MEENNEHIDGIKDSIDEIIGVSTVLRRKKKSEESGDKALFIKIINALERAESRSNILDTDLLLDFSSYNDVFYLAIDGLIHLHFGKDVSELIFFYLYERVSPDGEINELIDEQGNVAVLENASDLWELCKSIQSQLKNKIGKAKKK